MSGARQSRLADRARAWRRALVLGGFAVLGLVLIARAAQLQLLDHDFYRGQGEARQLRTVAIPAHRGNLLDRNGEPLAVSTPIQTLAGVPETLAAQPEALAEIARLLELDAEALLARVERAAAREREFVYVARHVPPADVERVLALDVAGLSLRREYRRYYPSGAAAAHVVGFTDIDDRGREGLEMAYDKWLAGRPGRRGVVRDRTGREIAGTELVEPATPGRDLVLSIDRRLQHFADRALVEALEAHDAQSASAVVLDVESGAVLAMANAPSYNPNAIAERRGARQRNRALTDVFEPGSTMKPFAMAAALESGKFRVDDIVYTSPGHHDIGRYRIRDIKDYGWLDLRGVIVRSSNVGISKIAAELDPERMWSLFDAFGFGNAPDSAFPGEVAGFFNHPSRWNRVEQATVAYGYGLSVSALQLARAYAALAAGGVLPPVRFLGEGEAPDEKGRRVLDADVAREVIAMLEAAVAEGTGHRAAVPGYRVAGKTGTSRRSRPGGYAEDEHVSVFAGFAPVSEPRLAAVVVVDDPKAGEYFGSVVAAPVFAEIMAQALRLEGVEPDAFDALDTFDAAMRSAGASRTAAGAADRSVRTAARDDRS